MALGLPSWREPEAVLGLATLAVAERAGVGRADIVAAARRALRTARGRSRSSTCRALDISSSRDPRAASPRGAPIRYLVPDAVAERIARGRLYR